MENIKCGIYKITNKINGKIYIGQSVDIKRRWWEHKARAFEPNSNCFNKPLYQAIRKYGISNFELTILCECKETDLNKKEAEYISTFNSIVPNGYNILPSSDKKFVKQPRCIQCGKIISKCTKGNLCRECYSKSIRKVERPSREKLKFLIRTTPFTQIGIQYGVADNTIRKWCDEMNLPKHSRKIKSYSDEEWEKI